jgi:phosphatidylinositol alpha-1,6-mannosyltransferase
MKVLFITRKWPPAVGGMEVYCAELTRELSGRVDLTTHALPGRADGRPPGSIRLAWFFLREAFYLLRHRNRYDVIHYGDLVLFPLAWWCQVLGRSCRQVISVHGTDIACRKAGLEDVEVVPLGVRLSTEHAAPEAPQNYLLFVGRLVRRKGAGWFIREVLPKLPSDLTLKIAGTVWDKDEGVALSNPRVEFLGPVYGEALSSLRRNALAVIMPNVPLHENDFVEGFGLTALEAAAGGAVLLAASLDGLVDSVEDGVTGILVEPADAQKWVEAIQNVASWSPEKRSAFLATAHERITQHYTWQRVAADTLALYRDRQPFR